MTEMLQEFDARTLRSVLGAFVTGVTVITTVDEAGAYYGMTANSFSSVSLEPALVLWSQSLTAPSFPAFRKARHYGISILSEDQMEISNRFARANADKFEGIATFAGKNGVPLIEGAAANIECELESCYPGGDHAVFLARVVRIRHAPRNPLVFHGGRYMVASHHDLRQPARDLGVSSLAHLSGVRLACAGARDLAAELDLSVGVGVWGNRGPTIVHWEESRRPVSVNLRTGTVLPILGSATGLTLAAHLPLETSAGLIDAELTNPDASWVPREALRTKEELEVIFGLIRDQGFARIKAAEAFTAMYGVPVNAVSVPVFDRTGSIVLALTALGHASENGQEWADRVVPALQRRADEISQKLGGSAPAGADRATVTAAARQG